eukprot:scaffold1272_cov250-Pinguiococcus_pyrenoidosus.AAC.86
MTSFPSASSRRAIGRAVPTPIIFRKQPTKRLLKAPLPRCLCARKPHASRAAPAQTVSPPLQLDAPQPTSTQNIQVAPSRLNAPLRAGKIFGVLSAPCFC